MKLQTKIIVFMLGLAFIPMISIITIDSFVISNELSSSLNETLEIQSNDLGIYADKLLSEAEDAIENLAENPATIMSALAAGGTNATDLWDTYEGSNWDNDGDPDLKGMKDSISLDLTNDIDSNFSTYLDAFVSINELVDIFITDSRGYTYTCAGGVPGDFLQVDEGWWTAARDTAAGRTIDFELDGEIYLMNFVYEVRDNDGTFVGMIKAGLDLSILSNTFQEEFASEGIEIIMLRDNGEIVSHSDSLMIGALVDTQMEAGKLENDLFISGLSTFTHGTTELDFAQIEYYASYVALNNWDFVLL
ncbi:MAG: cache domain-containing protein, partial [Candidatus Heimdallarchaeota archaeon]|nr:cache domain-containing protein [Candidatus Heimdallarchaeota archaeon]